MWYVEAAGHPSSARCSATDNCQSAAMLKKVLTAGPDSQTLVVTQIAVLQNHPGTPAARRARIANKEIGYQGHMNWRQRAAAA